MRLLCSRFFPTFHLSNQCKQLFIQNVNADNPCRAGSITSRKLFLITRTYTDDAPYRNKGRSLPPLMNFPEITWPSLIYSIKNFIFANFIRQWDKDFNMPEFIEGSKQAVEVVSHTLKDGDFNALEGLVVPETIEVLHNSISKMSMVQREQLAINKQDIYFQFPYQIGVMFDDEEKKAVEITMCYHALQGFSALMEDQETLAAGYPNSSFQSQYQEKLSILNYRFVKDFTRSVDESWQLNVVNHFKPVDHLK